MISGQDKTPEEGEHNDDIEEQDELDEVDEETTLRTQLGHVPGRLPRGWDQGTPIPGGKEISLDHATDAEWQRFLDSLDEEE
jgi:hypothetical protein